jgi:hypothetical protein
MKQRYRILFFGDWPIIIVINREAYYWAKSEGYFVARFSDKNF